MTITLTPYEALILCRDRAGSDSALAAVLGVTQPKVWRWVNQSKRLPAEHVLEAERLYGVSRHDLRPDIYPPGYPAAPDTRIEDDETGNSRIIAIDHNVATRAVMTDRFAGRDTGLRKAL